jgi:hypothetical protein
MNELLMPKVATDLIIPAKFLKLPMMPFLRFLNETDTIFVEIIPKQNSPLRK